MKTIVVNIQQTMTSLEIAELTGKQHKNVMQAIRNMEPAWVKVQGRKFALLQKTYNLPNGGTKMTPYYQLTKTECLYIATKFNDDLRVAGRAEGARGLDSLSSPSLGQPEANIARAPLAFTKAKGRLKEF